METEDFVQNLVVRRSKRGRLQLPLRIAGEIGGNGSMLIRVGVKHEIEPEDREYGNECPLPPNLAEQGKGQLYLDKSYSSQKFFPYKSAGVAQECFCGA